MTYYRRLPAFDYLGPKSLDEVSSMIEQYKGDARFLAGGTIVLHQMKERIHVRPYVIGLKGVAGLHTIGFVKNSGLTIGSMARLQDVADSEEVKKNCSLMELYKHYYMNHHNQHPLHYHSARYPNKKPH